MRKTFNDVKGNIGNNKKYTNSFSLKENESAFIKFLITDIDDIEVHTIHRLPVPTKNGNTFWKPVECLEDNCPICNSGEKSSDVAVIPILVLYNDSGEYAPEFKLFLRSTGWVLNSLIPFEARYGLDCIVECERKGQKTQTVYNLYEARKGPKGVELPKLPDIETIKADFNVTQEAVKDVITTWTKEEMNNYLSGTTAEEEKPKRRGF